MSETPGIQIFIACHKPAYVPDNQLLRPIQVGCALTETRYEGMLQDNDGADNISDKNSQYCEVTAQYWAWKSVDCDYYGFFHYRRYMSFADIYRIQKNGKIQGKKNPCPYFELDDIQEDLTEYKLDAAWMEKQIRQFELITVLRERINTTVYRQFCQYHRSEYLDRTLEILKVKYPEYGIAAEQYMHSKEVYYMNMYIMEKSLFHKYMKWLFEILTEYEQKYGLPEEQRMMGYLAERLFGVFYFYQREHGIRCAEVPYLKFYNTEENGKPVSGSNIRVFRLNPTKIQVKVDMRKLNQLFPAGSRRRILLRSIFLR